MNIVTLINKLEKQKQNIEAALSVLRAETETPVAAKKVTESLKNGSWITRDYKGKHWTQLPKNRAKVARLAKARALKSHKS